MSIHNKILNTNITTKNSAFTLIELMIVIALILILAVLTVPITLDFLARQTLKEEAQILNSNLKNAQAQAISSKNDSSFGIKFFINEESPRYVVFQGPSYVEREEGEDEVFYVSKGTLIEIVGEYTEIIFEKNTGIAQFK